MTRKINGVEIRTHSASIAPASFFAFGGDGLFGNMVVRKSPALVVADASRSDATRLTAFAFPRRAERRRVHRDMPDHVLPRAQPRAFKGPYRTRHHPLGGSCFMKARRAASHSLGGR